MDKKTDELHWRETYFILFPQDRRPTLKQVQAALALANERYQIENPAADDAGLLESVFVESSEDHAAVEISYEVGDAVIEQNLTWAKELQAELPADKLQQMMISDARLDLAHFERVPTARADAPLDVAAFGREYDDEFGAEEDAIEMLDPICILTVVDALAELTGGLTFDPASGEILS
jgi:hypothetical protein